MLTGCAPQGQPTDKTEDTTAKIAGSATTESATAAPGSESRPDTDGGTQEQQTQERPTEAETDEETRGFGDFVFRPLP